MIKKMVQPFYKRSAGKSKSIKENRLEGSKTKHSGEQKRNIEIQMDTWKFSFVLTKVTLGLKNI